MLWYTARLQQRTKQQTKYIARSSNGRTHGFGPWYRGSSPCRAASKENTRMGVFLYTSCPKQVTKCHLRQGLEKLLSIFWSGANKIFKRYTGHVMTEIPCRAAMNGNIETPLLRLSFTCR